jgi:hypothetical protein
VFALSTLNCTLATATSSLAFAFTVAVPAMVTFGKGEVMETVGGVLSASVANVISLLFAVLFFVSVESARKW